MAFVKVDKMHLVTGAATTNSKACGLVGNIKFPNKGAVQINF